MRYVLVAQNQKLKTTELLKLTRASRQPAA
jgi:hypothetical protein